MFFPKNFKLEGLTWGVHQYPDGQIQFWYEDYVQSESLNLRSHSLILTCSLFTSRDVDLLLQILETVRLEKLIIEYFYGARSDKRTQGDKILCHVPDYLNKLIRNTRFSQNLKILVHNPHCEIPGTTSYLSELPEEVLNKNYTGVIFPDYSAYDRMHSLLEQLKGNPYVIICSKTRNQVTGSIIEYKKPPLEQGDYLVLDDICDGGATFLRLAENKPSNVNLDLYVSHGLFTKGTTELSKVYKNIWCSKSCEFFQREPGIVVTLEPS